jgi:hypothetical protein
MDHETGCGMRYELWKGSDPELGGEQWTLLGPEHVRSREMLETWMRLTWAVEAESDDEAMQLVYDRKGWGHSLTSDEATEITTFVEVEGATPNSESE